MVLGRRIQLEPYCVAGEAWLRNKIVHVQALQNGGLLVWRHWSEAFKHFRVCVFYHVGVVTLHKKMPVRL